MPGVTKAGRLVASHPHIELRWMPDTEDFLRALSKLGCCTAADAKGSAHKSRKKGPSPTKDSPPESAEVLLGNLQLLVQLFSAVCRQQVCMFQAHRGKASGD